VKAVSRGAGKAPRIGDVQHTRRDATNFAFLKFHLTPDSTLVPFRLTSVSGELNVGTYR
jgi:hypothetical protein